MTLPILIFPDDAWNEHLVFLVFRRTIRRIRACHHEAEKLLAIVLVTEAWKNLRMEGRNAFGLVDELFRPDTWVFETFGKEIRITLGDSRLLKKEAFEGSSGAIEWIIFHLYRNDFIKGCFFNDSGDFDVNWKPYKEKRE